MATSPAQDQQYSFSTEDGKSIPLDIIRPKGLKKAIVPLSGVGSIDIPEDWETAVFFCKEGCYVQFIAAAIFNPLDSNTEYIDCLFVPPNTPTTSTVLPGNATVVIFDGATAASVLVVQQIQKWAGLALNRQISRR